MANSLFWKGVQLDEAEKRVEDLHSKLARLRSRKNVASTKNSPGDDIKVVKVERRSISPVRITEDSRQNQPQSRPQLVIPAVNAKISQPVLMVGSSSKDSNGSQFQSRKPKMSVQNNIVSKLKGSESRITPTEPEASEVQAKKGTKRKFGKIFTFCRPHIIRFSNVCFVLVAFKFCSAVCIKLCVAADQSSFFPWLYPCCDLLFIATVLWITEQKEHKELISLICSCSSPKTIHCQTGCFMPSQHKRKLRSLVLCPANDELFMTRYFGLPLLTFWVICDFCCLSTFDSTVSMGSVAL